VWHASIRAGKAKSTGGVHSGKNRKMETRLVSQGSASGGNLFKRPNIERETWGGWRQEGRYRKAKRILTWMCNGAANMKLLGKKSSTLLSTEVDERDREQWDDEWGHREIDHG